MFGTALRFCAFPADRSRSAVRSYCTGLSHLAGIRSYPYRIIIGTNHISTVSCLKSNISNLTSMCLPSLLMTGIFLAYQLFMFHVIFIRNPHHFSRQPCPVHLPVNQPDMKNKDKLTALIQVMMAVVIFLIMPQLSKAQATYKLAEGADATIKVLGSSNVHDWTMTATAMESKGTFRVAGKELKGISALSFSVAFKNLKSEHSSMDSRTYKTVNATSFPIVIYKLNTAAVSFVDKNKYLVKTEGWLAISGVSKPISMDVTAVVNSDNTITCTGSQKIKLTDYGIKPPSFMLGAMKVYDDLTIQFTLIYKNQTLLTKTL
jgi:polyisoprenoid-binding protein YceI